MLRPMTRLRAALLVPALAAIALAPLRAQTAADSAAIRATALDYVEGWYAGDADRMDRALSADLAKRIVYSDSLGRSRLSQMSAMGLVRGTRAGGGKDTPADKQEKEIRILDIFGNAASVRSTMSGRVDYMHLAKFNRRWVIVNVLWELKPGAAH